MANYAVRLIAPVLLGALILLYPAGGLRALGLGEARVDSWLGQPLDVSIRLLDIQSEEIESISVGPASLEDHERLGVPSETLGLGLQVTVDRRVDPPRVRVRSEQPVNDPVVQVLVDARWASGRVLREYTLFLDPPVVESAAPVRRVSETEERPAAAEPEPATLAPAEAPDRPTRRPAPEPADPRPDEPESVSATRGADSVNVAAGDTLWSIASNWRPEQSLSMDQVMLAIFNRNRSAFLGENINRMRSDVRLEMPSLDEVRRLDREEAERRIREHMRSWQPSATEEVPVVSDAGMPESSIDSSAAAEAEQAPRRQPEVEEAAPEENQATADTTTEPVHRLDVVPPEDEQYSEAAAVSDGEINRVRDSLADIESEIDEEGLNNQELDERVREIRDALEQRDMAGLAVAEESLAELEARLREVREARAEQERLAQGADDTGEGRTDRVSDYLRQLEEEFQSEREEAIAMAEEPETGVEAADDDADQLGEDDPAQESVADQRESDTEAGGSDRDADEASGDAAAPAASSEAQPSSGGLMAWLWPVLGLLLVLAAVAGVLFWRRRQGAESGAWKPGADSGAVAAARSAVARDPADLGARLALLRALADDGRDQEFTDAFDQMYQEVDDETAPEWQEALTLASAHAPDHPLLRPHETAIEGDEDFDRRADEMLGMLDVEDGESERDSGTEPFRADDTFDLDLDEEEPGEEEAADRPVPDLEFDEGAEFGEVEQQAPDSEAGQDEDEETDKRERFDTDMDLAVLSERLDDPSADQPFDGSRDEEGDDANFDEFEEIDEYAATSEEGEPETSEPEAVDLELDDQDSDGPELDLDFEPARDQEADEVFGEAGARDEDKLDLDFSSELDQADQASDDDTLDFAPGDAEAPTEADAGQDEDVVPVEENESADDEAAEPEAAAGGTLSDEDADVKLDLARAYISVDLADSARAVLEEVINDGSAEKREEAQKLLDSMV